MPNGRAAGEDTRSEKPLMKGGRGAGEGCTDTQSSPVLQARGTATVWQVGVQRCQVLCAAFQMEQFLELQFLIEQIQRTGWWNYKGMWRFGFSLVPTNSTCRAGCPGHPGHLDR